jgi:hypothetical protein
MFFLNTTRELLFIKKENKGYILVFTSPHACRLQANQENKKKQQTILAKRNRSADGVAVVGFRLLSVNKPEGFDLCHHYRTHPVEGKLRGLENSVISFFSNMPSKSKEDACNKTSIFMSYNLI